MNSARKMNEAGVITVMKLRTAAVFQKASATSAPIASATINVSVLPANEPLTNWSAINAVSSATKSR
ncbi:unannotated protein [freshwater metagenome]|uniref:Unannotated protein n=1 Tax=freshwater metagenome TaxID=449393 RepID=A0A6J5YV92_9ZZZZ